MGIQSIFSHKFGLVVAVVATALFAVAPFAQAESYYYPQQSRSYYQPHYYQQPVYQYRTSTNVNQYFSQIRSLQAQLAALQNRYRSLYGNVHTGYSSNTGYNTYHGNYYSHGRRYDVDVDTLSATNVDEEEATLRGDIDLDGAQYADVYFEYSEDGDLDEKSRTKRVYRDGRFSIEVDDLDDDERYFFRAVAKASNGQRSYGQVRSLETDDDHRRSRNRNDDEPDVDTGRATDIDDDSAEIHGEVDMNDFDDGDVFFVWGEDEDEVEDVEDEDSFRDVDEMGDDLQKQRVYTNLDGERRFWLTIWGLDDDTDYYYRICVEYEDDDYDETLECGDVEDFETDD